MAGLVCKRGHALPPHVRHGQETGVVVRAAGPVERARAQEGGRETWCMSVQPRPSLMWKLAPRLWSVSRLLVCLWVTAKCNALPCRRSVSRLLRLRTPQRRDERMASRERTPCDTRMDGRQWPCAHLTNALVSSHQENMRARGLSRTYLKPSMSQSG